MDGWMDGWAEGEGMNGWGKPQGRGGEVVAMGGLGMGMDVQQAGGEDRKRDRR